jgi:predicted enzyme related to lactoylglutathione lyase
MPGMSIRTSPWPAGVPCWADLTVPDLGAAKAFYGAVLGWTFQDTGDDFGGYVIAQARGAAAAGIGPLQQEGQRPAWTLYLASDDVEKTAASIAGNGGTVILPPGDVGAMGRLCIAADPSGGVFGVWQHGVHIGAGLVNEPGGMAWEDLRSTDPEAARAFYAAVFGYRFDPLPDAGPDYRMFALPDEQGPMGGMGGMAGAPEGTPSHWLVYFMVPDADAATDAARSTGGTVLAPAFDTPFGRMAGLVDPAGAVFWVAQADPASMPDRSG